MTDQTKDYILYGIVILALYFIFKGKQSGVVSATLGSYDASGKAKFPADLTNEFDYAICGISADVIKNGLPIRVCIDPATNIEYPVEAYPQGNYGQVIFLRDKLQIARSNLINGVT
jgi:hypothetical protein